MKRLILALALLLPMPVSADGGTGIFPYDAQHAKFAARQIINHVCGREYGGAMFFIRKDFQRSGGYKVICNSEADFASLVTDNCCDFKNLNNAVSSVVTSNYPSSLQVRLFPDFAYGGGIVTVLHANGAIRDLGRFAADNQLSSTIIYRDGGS